MRRMAFALDGLPLRRPITPTGCAVRTITRNRRACWRFYRQTPSSRTTSMSLSTPEQLPERRRFLRITGSAVAAASVLGWAAQSGWAQAADATAAQGNAQPAADLPKPVKLPAMQEDETEKSEMPVQLGKDGRLGIAIVGLGRLSLEQIMPALASSKRCRVTALVSGDAQKARRVAAMYDVPES